MPFANAETARGQQRTSKNAIKLRPTRVHGDKRLFVPGVSILSSCRMMINLSICHGRDKHS